ncbi:MAG: ThuA domain-containing protein [Planctomycetaceae bacterium]
MIRRHMLTLSALSLGYFLSLTAAWGEDKPAPARILFVTQSKGFKHGSVNRKENELSPAEIALTQLGQQTGLFKVDCTQDASDINKANLENYDIVAFYTTGDLPIADADKDYFFNDWLKQKGHGFMGFHSAADTYHKYEPYYTLVGGTFIGHPWGSGSKVTLTNHEPNHACVAAFGQDFVIQDEIYMYRNWKPENCRVLLSLDYSKSPTGGEINTEHGYHVPVCWVKNWGEGKMYFNNLGHNEKTWATEAFLDSITAAVQWIRGQKEAPAEPNPSVSAAQEEKAKSDAVKYGFKIRQKK